MTKLSGARSACKAPDVPRRMIFKEYEQKYGKDRVIHIHSLYYLRASEEFVEKEIKEIKENDAVLQQKSIRMLKSFSLKYGLRYDIT